MLWKWVAAECGEAQRLADEHDINWELAPRKSKAVFSLCGPDVIVIDVAAAALATQRGKPDRSVIRWIFELYLPRSTGFGPVRSPLFQGSHVHRVDRAPRPVQLAADTEFVEDQAVELGPRSGLRPLREPPVARRSGRTERRRLQLLLPGTTRRGHDDDRGQYFPVTVPTPTTALRPRRCLRHDPLQQFPQLVRHQPFNDPHHASQDAESPK